MKDYNIHPRRNGTVERCKIRRTPVQNIRRNAKKVDSATQTSVTLDWVRELKEVKEAKQKLPNGDQTNELHTIEERITLKSTFVESHSETFIIESQEIIDLTVEEIIKPEEIIDLTSDTEELSSEKQYSVRENNISLAKESEVEAIKNPYVISRDPRRSSYFDSGDEFVLDDPEMLFEAPNKRPNNIFSF